MQQLRIVWQGDRTDDMEWLFHRVSRFSSDCIDSIEVHNVEQGVGALQDACQERVDRLIFSCVNRVDYPQTAIRWMQRNHPEVPVALALGSYWEGSRRTGVGAFPHVAMPWHRWWDGWVDWLDATAPALFEPCTGPMTYDAKSKLTALPSSGVVVANCQQTASAWRLAAEQVQASVHVLSACQAAAASLTQEVHWVLWDDSCLNTSARFNTNSQVADSLAGVVSSFPRSRVFCAFSIPRSSDWSKLQDLGVGELLTKPNSGRGLQRAIAHLMND